jgi:hypothetical protein
LKKNIDAGREKRFFLPGASYHPMTGGGGGVQFMSIKLLSSLYVGERKVIVSSRESRHMEKDEEEISIRNKTHSGRVVVVEERR